MFLTFATANEDCVDTIIVFMKKVMGGCTVKKNINISERKNLSLD